MRLLKSFLLMFLIAVTIYADGGSLYTRKGIGDLYFALNARRLGLGGGGVALSSLTDISTLNPAGWYSLKHTRFETGFYYNGLDLKNSNAGMLYSQASLSGFTLAFPLDTAKGISLAAGLIPYSNVMYEVTKESTDPLIGKYTSSYEGNGGLNKVFFGITSKLPFGFVLGASFEYYYGKIEYNANIKIDNAEYKDGIFKNLNNFQGRGINVGILSPDLSKIFGSKDISDLRFGLSVNKVFNMKRDSSEVSGSSDSTFISSSMNQDVILPYRLNAGVTVKLFNRYLLVADYFYQPFEDFTINNVKPGIYQNLKRYSIGFEYTNPKLQKETFWENLALRLGLSYEESQYKINSTSLTSYALYAGFSMPLGFGNTVDIAFSIGKRGTTDNNLIKENFYNLSLGFSLGELWFKKTDR